jgi:ribonucleotide reductase beta subunit family protein with ferritin-like domain
MFISRDEGLHVQNACLGYNNYVINKVPVEIFNQMIKEAVEIECEFTNYILPYKLKEMNQELMKEYIKFVADRLAKQLNYEPIYGAKNPFPFMETSALSSKTNFFERKVTEYARHLTYTSGDFDV